MNKLTGMIVLGALLLTSQTSMAYSDNVRLNGFSSETEALDAGKQWVQEVTDEARELPFYRLAKSCQIPIATDLQIKDIQVEKKWMVTENGAVDTFDAVINYSYDCEVSNWLN